MAPTVMRAKGLRIVIYPKDHNPPHVHVFGPGAEAKFAILPLECIFSRGFSARAVMAIENFLRGKEANLLEHWHELQE